MKTFAVVSPAGGIVTNTVAGENKADVEAIVGPVVEITAETGPASIGWSWDGTIFTDPNAPIVP